MTKAANNYKAVKKKEACILLCTVRKIKNKTLLKQLRYATDITLREPVRIQIRQSCIDQIYTLRRILQQAIEKREDQNVTFIHFEKTFDSIDREVIWKILSDYEIQIST